MIRRTTDHAEVNKAPKYFALIPAAGGGTRFGGAVPKQYQLLGARTMLEHSVEAMLGDQRVERVLIVVAPSDGRWARIGFDRRVAVATVGGETRAESVRNGLKVLPGASDSDWVLVHDAARPCLAAAQLAKLVNEAGDEDSGGLLAVPLADTLKRGEDRRVALTLDRASLWCAQTPQLFRVGSLRAALSGKALAEVTDEASAMERAGHAPRLVEGVSTNLKVTTIDDLMLARAVLAAQGRL